MQIVPQIMYAQCYRDARPVERLFSYGRVNAYELNFKYCQQRKTKERKIIPPPFPSILIFIGNSIFQIADIKKKKEYLMLIISCEN